MKKEMEDVESWIDDKQQEFYAFLAKSGSSGRRRSSFILSQECMDNIGGILENYEEKGFKKKRIQDGMEFTDALRPFDGSRFGTLREKHNTFMNFILTLHSQQKRKRDEEQEEIDRVERSKKELEEVAEKERRDNLALAEAQRLENERRERERIEAEIRHKTWRTCTSEPEPEAKLPQLTGGLDAEGNPLQLSLEHRNTFSDGRFIGSIYINKDSPNWTEKYLKSDKSSNWRVKL